MARKEIVSLEISEISLVDDPANEDAKVEIVKMAKPKAVNMADVANDLLTAISELAPEIVEKALNVGSYPANSEAASTAEAILKETLMDIEKLAKSLEDADAKIEKMQADLEAAKAKTEEITKRAEKAEADLKAANEKIEKGAKAGEAEETDEDILKSLPEAVRKRFEDMNSRLEKAEKDRAEEIEKAAKLTEDREVSEAIEKARKLGAPDPDKVGPMLRRIAKGKTTEEDLKVVEAIIKQNAAIEVKLPDLFKSIGSAVAVEGDPEEILKVKADEIKKAKPELSAAQAYDEALQQNPAIYAAYKAKRHPAVG